MTSLVRLSGEPLDVVTQFFGLLLGKLGGVDRLVERTEHRAETVGRRPRAGQLLTRIADGSQAPVGVLRQRLELGPVDQAVARAADGGQSLRVFADGQYEVALVDAD